MIRRIEQNHVLRSLYFDKTEIEKVLMLSCGFSLALSLFRILYTGTHMFVFLGWNLFLAFVPFAISRNLLRRPQWISRGWKFALLFGAWLLFLPNSFYIITDLFHLEKGGGVPLWYDLALLLSFAWNGLLLGILSLRQMECILEARFSFRNEWLFTAPLMFLNAFGVYLGRYLRYNSWDVVSDPFPLLRDVLYLMAHPLQHRFDWSMIICYTLLMTFIYVSVKKMGKEVW